MDGIYSVDMLDNGMVHIPGRMGRDSVRFHHTTQNSAQFKTYELFICEIFHLIFSNCSWPWLAETIENKTGWIRGDYCMSFCLMVSHKYFRVSSLFFMLFSFCSSDSIILNDLSSSSLIVSSVWLSLMLNPSSEFSIYCILQL